MWLAGGPRARDGVGPRGSEGAGRSSWLSRTEPAGARKKEGKERVDADRWDRLVSGGASDAERAERVRGWEQARERGSAG